MYRSVSIAHSKDRPYQLRVVERSRFRDIVTDGYESFASTVTRHWLCCRTGFGYHILNSLVSWAWKVEKDILIVDVTREDIRALQADSDGWWPGDPDEDDEEDD